MARKLRRLALKELADNALDAADAAGRYGRATVQKLDRHRYAIEDEGGGIPGTPEQLADLFALNRPMVSGKFWRLPERGALGNGLRVIVGCVAATGGTIEITTRNQRVVLKPLKTGRTEVLEIAEAERAIGTRVVVTFGPDLPEDDSDLVWAQNAITFAEKAGGPYNRAASPHWFDLDQLAETFATIEPADTTVRQFVERLDGCSGAKAGKIAAPFGKNRTCRSMGEAEIAALLAAAQEAAKPIKPEALGVVGAKAFNPEDYGYSKQVGGFVHGTNAPQATIPFVVEAWVTVANRKGTDAGTVVMANRTPIVGDVVAYRMNDDRKTLTFSGAGIGGLYIHELAKGDCEIILHIASPFIPIVSIGKSANLWVFQEAIGAAIRQAFNRSRGRLAPDPIEAGVDLPKPAKPPPHNRVVLANLDEAIAITSKNGTYIYSQRNLFYKVRPYVELATGGEALGWKNFCDILTDYGAEHGAIPGLIRDPRGSFFDLRTETELGTTGVSSFERKPWLFHKVLFCEKEDHKRILQQAGWHRLHDCALMSSKGYPTRAARDLIDAIADTASDEPVTVFCIHDADAAGTMIYQALQEATRARPRRRIEIVDIGLQPWDALEMGLPVEHVSYEKPQPVADYVKARAGRDWETWLQKHRIELNAMTPDELIGWLTEHVENHGDLKLVPPPEVAMNSMRDHIEEKIRSEVRARVLREMEDAIREEVEKRIAEIDPQLPDESELTDSIREQILDRRHQHWTDAVAEIADELVDDESA